MTNPARLRWWLVRQWRSYWPGEFLRPQDCTPEELAWVTGYFRRIHTEVARGSKHPPESVAELFRRATEVVTDA